MSAMLFTHVEWNARTYKRNDLPPPKKKALAGCDLSDWTLQKQSQPHDRTTYYVNIEYTGFLSQSSMHFGPKREETDGDIFIL